MSKLQTLRPQTCSIYYFEKFIKIIYKSLILIDLEFDLKYLIENINNNDRSLLNFTKNIQFSTFMRNIINQNISPP